MRIISVEALVIGSGAGGATTAAALAAHGLQVAIVEEGPPRGETGLSEEPDDPGSIETMSRLYRRRGMTPIIGSVPIAYVEGCCVGGSTEINSGFWHRLPPDIEAQWKARFELLDFSSASLEEHFQWAERALHVALSRGELPESSLLIGKGAARLGWSAEEVPRIGQGLVSPAGRFSKATGQGMSRNLIPEAQAKGARLFSRCRVARLVRKGRRVIAAIAEMSDQGGRIERVRIEARHVFVCGGAAQTPALLRRSGITRNIGDSFLIHPMLKVSARFDRRIDAHDCAMPLLQVKDFRPDITIGGSYFSLGHLAVVLSENWKELSDRISDHRNMATYYVGVRGLGKGSVRPSRLASEPPRLKYNLDKRDVHNLSAGLSHLSTLLLEAGAREIYPSVSGLAAITSRQEAKELLERDLAASRLGLTTVHAFSSCPMGERSEICAADSHGLVHGFENLYVNDASMLPHSPGINPQGTIMAIARRNVLHFLERHK